MGRKGPLKEKRIGLLMREVVDYVNRYPGCLKIDAARYVAPHPEAGKRCGLSYGYRTVDRALAAGLISATWIGGRYNLELTPKGTDLVRSWQ